MPLQSTLLVLIFIEFCVYCCELLDATVLHFTTTAITSAKYVTNKM